MKTKESVEKLKQEINEKEALIVVKRKEIVNMILNVQPCTSHIYKRDLWNVGRCIFCGRLEF